MASSESTRCQPSSDSASNGVYRSCHQCGCRDMGATISHSTHLPLLAMVNLADITLRSRHRSTTGRRQSTSNILRSQTIHKFVCQHFRPLWRTSPDPGTTTSQISPLALHSFEDEEHEEEEEQLPQEQHQPALERSSSSSRQVVEYWHQRESVMRRSLSRTKLRLSST